MRTWRRQTGGGRLEAGGWRKATSPPARRNDEACWSHVEEAQHSQRSAGFVTRQQRGIHSSVAFTAAWHSQQRGIRSSVALHDSVAFTAAWHSRQRSASRPQRREPLNGPSRRKSAGLLARRNDEAWWSHVEEAQRSQRPSGFRPATGV